MLWIFSPQRCFDPTLIVVLKILSRFVVCLHVKDRFLVESCTFLHFRVQECNFFFWKFSRKLDSLLVLQAICRPRVSWFLSTSACWFTISSEFTLLFLATESASLCFLVTIFASDRRASASSLLISPVSINCQQFGFLTWLKCKFWGKTVVSILPGIESVATGNSDSSKIIFWRLSLCIPFDRYLPDRNTSLE